ncbi:MAG: hypothetical protein HY646_14090, partial [Acidobacteria bacterium]|nr:hypothetical protein [Acidobacteriota bacterium]
MLAVPASRHAPDQPAKFEDSGDQLAVKVTDVLRANEALQIVPQSIPDGLDDTLPLPDPVLG